jgi:hypothetical protein
MRKQRWRRAVLQTAEVKFSRMEFADASRKITRARGEGHGSAGGFLRRLEK